MKNIFFYSPYYSFIALGLCVYCVIYLMDHPPPPKTSIEKVKIVKNISILIRETPPIRTITNKSNSRSTNNNILLTDVRIINNGMEKLEQELLIEAKLTNTVAPPLISQCDDVNRSIHDIFLFSYEADILEIRLYELYDVVDTFHIIESDFTFHGDKIDPFFATKLQHQKRFKKFLPKIKLYNMHKKYKHVNKVGWAMETDKMNYAVHIANELDPNSLVIFGHVDELPSRQNVLKAKTCRGVRFPLNFGIWMPVSTFKYKFRSDFPVKNYPYTIGEPTMGYPNQIKGLSRGKLKNVLLGGIHLTNYCYRPNALMKELTGTEYHNKISLVHKNEETFLHQCQAKRSLFRRCKMLNGKEPFVHIPWIMKQNPHAYSSWYGKLDNRLKIKGDKITGKAVSHVKFIAQAGQDKYINNLLNDKKINTGVFVEFGGFMGDEYSNSWFFEKSYNWKGIMVEVEKKYISHLKRVRPNAIVYNNAVCPTGVDTITFAESKIGGWSGILDKYDDPRWHRQIKKTYKVKCVDLNVILEENNMFHVDYMTVDTEGSEIDILETFRFDKFDVTYIQVERNMKTIAQKKRKNYLIRFMKKNGYELEKVFDIGNKAIDVLFKKSI